MYLTRDSANHSLLVVTLSADPKNNMDCNGVCLHNDDAWMCQWGGNRSRCLFDSIGSPDSVSSYVKSIILCAEVST